MFYRQLLFICSAFATWSVLNAALRSNLKNNSYLLQPKIKYADDEKPIVCYYSYVGKGQDLQPEQIDPNLCSHILVAGVSILNNSVDFGPEIVEGLRETLALKKKRPDLKVMVMIGNEKEQFSKAVSSATYRKMTIDSILSFVKTSNLDGVDFDWEFPSWNSPIEDKGNFATFLKELRNEIDSSKEQVLVSVAVSATIPIIEVAYDAKALAAYCDFVNIMTYDFHDYKPFEDPFTGHNSPLFPRAVEKAYFATLNMAFAAEYWVQIGVPRSKLNVGIPTYAHCYQLAIAELNGVDAPAVADAGDWTFSQCCKFIANGATVKFDNESLVPYMYKNLTWISYENEDSVTYKAKWIKQNNFGGIMVFDLNTDDWTKSCGDEDFPLIKIIKNIFNSP